MAHVIDNLEFGRIPRPSIAHNIDKINEIVDYINENDDLIHNQPYQTVTGNDAITSDNALANSNAKGFNIHGNTIVENNSLQSVDIDGMKVIGFNQWDINAIPVVQGTFTNPNNNTNVHTEKYIPVLPNVEYYQRHDTLSKIQGQYVNFFDADKTLIDNLSIYTKESFSFTTPANTRYVRFMWYASAGIVPADIMALRPCLNISNSTLNGTYRPYVETNLEIPAATYFPEGMRGAGTAYDELTSEKAVTRIGSRAYQSGDESDTSVITDGTTTYYALSTPTEVIIDPPIDTPIIPDSQFTAAVQKNNVVPVPFELTYYVDANATIDNVIARIEALEQGNRSTLGIAPVTLEKQEIEPDIIGKDETKEG